MRKFHIAGKGHFVEHGGKIMRVSPIKGGAIARWLHAIGHKHTMKPSKVEDRNHVFAKLMASL